MIERPLPLEDDDDEGMVPVANTTSLSATDPKQPQEPSDDSVPKVGDCGNGLSMTDVLTNIQLQPFENDGHDEQDMGIDIPQEVGGTTSHPWGTHFAFRH
jgi:hypothetical protein